MPQWEALAREKLRRVLGDARALLVFDETMRAVGLAKLESADDLYRFGQQLAKRGGFEAAVGGLLSVQASLNRPPPSK